MGLKVKKPNLLFKELLAIFIFALIAFVISGYFDVLENFIAFSQAHEAWELDEILVTSMVLTFVLLAKVIKRSQDLALEIELRKIAEQKIQELAFQDTLTNLPNRRIFMTKLSFVMKQNSQNHSQQAILFIDLDNFKEVNDTFGHSTGDDLLCQFARRARGCIKQNDILSRIAGDEFSVLLSNIKDPHDAAIVAERIIQGLSLPFSINGNQIRVSLSIGIAITPQDSISAEELMSFADKAMYFVKHQGKNNYQFFSQEINSKEIQRLEIISTLKNAIEFDKFFLEYQPVYDKNQRIVQLEALLRLNSKETGLISPNLFIPIAEKNGLIGEITTLVISSVCKQLKHWRLQNVNIKKVAINISSIELRDPFFVGIVEKILKKNDIAASNIEFEITETAIMQDIDQSIITLNKLRDLGITLAIDDFGVEYSSMSYLRILPIQKLKIDKMFVDDIENSEQARLIFNAIAALGKALDLFVITEGVETEFQARYVLKSETNAIQGFYFSRPLHPDVITKKMQCSITHVPKLLKK